MKVKLANALFIAIFFFCVGFLLPMPTMPKKSAPEPETKPYNIILATALHPKLDDVLAIGGYFGYEAPGPNMRLANAENSYLAVSTNLGEKLIHTTESNPIYSLAWSCTEYGNYLAVGNYDRVSVWSLESILNKGTDRLMWLRPDHSGPVNCLAFSPDGQFLASGDGDGWINFWYSWNGQKVWHEEGIDASTILALAFSNDKNYRLAVGGVLWPTEGHDNAKSVLRVYQFEHGHQLELAVDLGDLLPHTPDVTIDYVLPITALAWSPDGKLLASGTRKKVFLWDVKLKKRLLSLDTDFDVETIAFSIDGQQLAAAGGNQVKIWPLVITKENTKPLGEHMVGATIHSLRFNKKGAILLGTDKGTLVRYLVR